MAHSKNLICHQQNLICEHAAHNNISHTKALRLKNSIIPYSTIYLICSLSKVKAKHQSVCIFNTKAMEMIKITKSLAGDKEIVGFIQADISKTLNGEQEN